MSIKKWALSWLPLSPWSRGAKEIAHLRVIREESDTVCLPDLEPLGALVLGISRSVRWDRSDTIDRLTAIFRAANRRNKYQQVLESLTVIQTNVEWCRYSPVGINRSPTGTPVTPRDVWLSLPGYGLDSVERWSCLRAENPEAYRAAVQESRRLLSQIFCPIASHIDAIVDLESKV